MKFSLAQLYVLCKNYGPGGVLGKKLRGVWPWDFFLEIYIPAYPGFYGIV